MLENPRMTPQREARVLEAMDRYMTNIMTYGNSVYIKNARQQNMLKGTKRGSKIVDMIDAYKWPTHVYRDGNYSTRTEEVEADRAVNKMIAGLSKG